MIIYNISTDLWNFWDKYLSLYSAIQFKKNRLTNAERTIMVEIILSERDPFRKEGRKEIMEKLDYSNSAYSINLNRLVKKGLLERKDKRLYISKVVTQIRDVIQTKGLKGMDMTFRFKFDEE